MHPQIHVKNLEKIFKFKQSEKSFFANFKSLFFPKYTEVTAVDKISFDICEGEMVAFIGPNGAGKSTTVKMLTGILYPSSGICKVLGLNPGDDRVELSKHIGTVFGQKSQLWYHLPAIDTFNLLYRIYELDFEAYKQRLNFLVTTFEVSDYLYVPVRKLSLGQRMRCELIASLIHKPKILFLDEPTIGLDVIAKQQVRDFLKLLNEKENLTVLLTSHDAGDIEAITNRTIIINHGKIIFDAETAKLKKDYINKKIIELIFENAIEDFTLDGVEIIERESHRVKFAVDLKKISLENIMQQVFQKYKILDVNIYETPLEEIISLIYKDAHTFDSPSTPSATSGSLPLTPRLQRAGNTSGESV